MYKILGIQSIKSKKNGKDYLVFHLSSLSPIPQSQGSGYTVETVFCDISLVDVPALVVGDKISVYYNKQGFLTFIQKV